MSHSKEVQNKVIIALKFLENVKAVQKLLASDSRSKPPHNATTLILSEHLKVNKSTIKCLRYILENGIPSLIKLIKNGNIGVQPAYELSKLSMSEQIATIQKGGVAAIRSRIYNKENLNNEELQKFIELDKNIEIKVKSEIQEFKDIMEGSTELCLPPNEILMWCNTCQWGFKIFKPYPGKIFCPHCRRKNVTVKTEFWNPRIKY